MKVYICLDKLFPHKTKEAGVSLLSRPFNFRKHHNLIDNHEPIALRRDFETTEKLRALWLVKNLQFISLVNLRLHHSLSRFACWM